MCRYTSAAPSGYRWCRAGGQKSGGAIWAAEDQRQRLAIELHAVSLARRSTVFTNRILATTGAKAIDIAASAALEEIIASSSVQEVAPTIPYEGIVTAVAGQDIGQAVARPMNGRRATEGEVFDMGAAEAVGDRAEDRIRALIGIFDRTIARLIDDIEIITHFADERIGTNTAIESVVSSSTREVLLALLPVRILARLLPVPCMAAVPLRVRCSTLAPSV